MRSLHAPHLRGARGEGASDDLPAHKEALAALKAKGKKLGGIRPKTIEKANERAEALRPVLKELEGQSANAIARELNDRKVPTPTVGLGTPQTVIRVQRRLKGAA